MCRVIFIYFFSERAAWGGGGVLPDFFFLFFFSCSNHERDWPPCKVVFRVDNQIAECEKQQQLRRSRCVHIFLQTTTLHTKRKLQWCKNTRKKRHLQRNKNKAVVRLQLRVAVGAHACRRTIERRAAASTKAYRRKQKRNKTNVTPEKIT